MKRVKHDARDLTDEVLTRAREGNKAALTEVFRAVDGLVRWRAGTYRVDADSRDDLISIGRLAVFDALRTYRPGKGQFLAWMTQWVHARMWTSLRTQMRHGEYLDAFAKRQGDAPKVAEEILCDEAIAEEVREAVNELPGHLRKAIKARMAGATLETVGREADRSRECMRKWEQHAHQLLRESLERRGAA